LFYNKEANQIGIKLGVDGSHKGAFKLDYRELRIEGFLEHFKIVITKTQRYEPFEQNGMLVIDLNNPLPEK
jgi:hypothetical protein